MSRRSSILLFASSVVALSAAAMLSSCSQGEGSGKVAGVLSVPDCWTGPFELSPDFLAAVPFRETLRIRIQSGSDFQSFSDGLSILIEDVRKLRPDPARAFPGLYGKPVAVDLPPEITPPGVPVKAKADPAFVSLALYLQKSCRTQNVTVYAVSEVTIPKDGTCDAAPMMGADPTAGCDPDREAPGGPGTGKSVISFTHVFNGSLDEPQASERLTAGCFDVYLADPRDIAPGGIGGPPPCRGHIRGAFSFYFERGRPSQPFP